MPMKKIKTWLLGNGEIYAIKVTETDWCYVKFGRGLGKYVYPFVTCGGFLPNGWFNALNWRWMISFGGMLEADLMFAGHLPKGDDDKWNEHYLFWANNRTRGLEVHRRRYPDGRKVEYSCGVPITPEEITFAKPPITQREEVDDLLQFLRDRLPEMTRIDASMATLVQSYDTKQEAPDEPGRIEVWIDPQLPDPEGTTFEDFIDAVLDRAEQGCVGEFADLKDYQFASCDVEDANKAARALTKAFKKGGYTTGIEIKEIGGKARAWKLE